MVQYSTGVLTLYGGENMGQGGASFELELVFANKKLAVKYISKKPMIALERW